MADFVWRKHYPAGVAHEIGAMPVQSLPELFRESCKKFGHLVAFENMGKSLTYAQVDKLSDDFAAYLQQKLGLKKGERIAIQMPNLLQFPVALIGSLKAGLIVVNTNPLYTPREMEHQFKDAGVSAIVIVENFAYNLETIRQNIPAKHIIVTSMGDMLGGLKGMIVNFVVRKVKKLVPAFNLPGAHSFKEALAEGASLKLQQFCNTQVVLLEFQRVHNYRIEILSPII
jgi:long-chain acyl-CoA synthetase